MKPLDKITKKEPKINNDDCVSLCCLIDMRLVGLDFE